MQNAVPFTKRKYGSIVDQSGGRRRIPHATPTAKTVGGIQSGSKRIRTDDCALVNSKADKQNLIKGFATEEETATNKNPHKFDVPVHRLKDALLNQGIPGVCQILEKYKELGIENLHPWQARGLAVAQAAFDQAENLLVQAPTGTGKTLFSEILLLRQVCQQFSPEDTQKLVLYIITHVADASEKVKRFQHLFGQFFVQHRMGHIGNLSAGSSLNMKLREMKLIVCTVERGDLLVKQLMQEGTIHQVGFVIADEVHMLADRTRGHVYERLLAKLLAWNNKLRHVKQFPPIPIVAQSATLSAKDLTLLRWLRARRISTSVRPMKLNERIVHSGKCFPFCPPSDTVPSMFRHNTATSQQSNVIEHIQQIKMIKPTQQIYTDKTTKQQISSKLSHQQRSIHRNSTSNMFYQICKQHLGLQENILVFVKTIRSAENLAKSLAHKTGAIARYHHGGLDPIQRTEIEQQFKRREIDILVSTPTLQVGVNIAPDIVIIRHALSDPVQYTQMIGRAGRLVKSQSHRRSQVGEHGLVSHSTCPPHVHGRYCGAQEVRASRISQNNLFMEAANVPRDQHFPPTCCRSSHTYIVAQKQNGTDLTQKELRNMYERLLIDGLGPIVSQLRFSMNTAALEGLVITKGCSLHGLCDWIGEYYLFGYQNELELHNLVEANLQRLLEEGFVSQSDEIFQATKLGEAAFASGLNVAQVSLCYSRIKLFMKNAKISTFVANMRSLLVPLYDLPSSYEIQARSKALFELQAGVDWKVLSTKPLWREKYGWKTNQWLSLIRDCPPFVRQLDKFLRVLEPNPSYKNLRQNLRKVAKTIPIINNAIQSKQRIPTVTKRTNPVLDVRMATLNLSTAWDVLKLDEQQLAAKFRCPRRPFHLRNVSICCCDTSHERTCLTEAATILRIVRQTNQVKPT